MGDWQPGDKIMWRRRGERRWKRGVVRRVYNDTAGSISLWDKRGLHATVPDDPECIKRRKR